MPIDEAAVLNMHHQGMTSRQIGEAFGKSKTPILHILRAHGIRRTKSTRPCLVCGKPTFYNNSRDASGRGKYCSRACQYADKHGKVINLKHGDIQCINGKQIQPAEYRIWSHMKRRCLDPTTHNYRWYGGRGIKVCQRWIDSYADFLADMGRRPSEKHSIDRIDNDGNYEPSNCRWATYAQQAVNKQRRSLNDN